MPVLKTVRAIFTAEVDDFQADIKKAENQVGDFQEKAKKGKESAEGFGAGVNQAHDTFKKILATGALIGVVKQVGDFVKESIMAAADVGEMQAKFNAVFKETAGDVENQLGEMGKTLGRSKYDLMDYAATFQDTFVPLGFARDKAAEMSVQLVQLAEDLASFNNLNTADVARDLQSALVGNTETLRKYGVVANETAIKAKALELGLWDGTGAMDAQSKAAAILQITLDGTVDAQGNAAREAESFTGQIRTLSSQFGDLKVAIGEGFIPSLEAGMPWLVEWLGKLVEGQQAENELNRAVNDGVISFGEYTSINRRVTLGLTDMETELEKVREKTALQDEFLGYANAEMAEFKKRTEEAAGAQAQAVDDIDAGADAYERLTDPLDRINSALQKYNEKKLFESLSQHMDPQTALNFGIQLGVIDEKMLLMDQIMPTLVDQMNEMVDDGIMNAAQASEWLAEQALAAHNALKNIPSRIDVEINVTQNRTIPTRDEIQEFGYTPDAEGGMVAGGGAYWVGEKGPEPFFPSVDGVIISRSDALRALSAGSGSSGGDVYNFYNYSQAAAALSLAIVQQQKHQRLSSSMGG